MPRKTTPKPVITSIPITKARANLGELVKRVHLNQEYFILEKDGVPIAGLMNINDFEDYLELRDPQVWKDIRKSYQEYLAGKGRPAEELLSELRAAEAKRTKHPRRQNV